MNANLKRHWDDKARLAVLFRVERLRRGQRVKGINWNIRKEEAFALAIGIFVVSFLLIPGGLKTWGLLCSIPCLALGLLYYKVSKRPTNASVVIDRILVDYEPVDSVAFAALQRHAISNPSELGDAIDQWIRCERVAVLGNKHQWSFAKKVF